ncbi:MAG: hypothetical protein ACLSAP_12055 [Oscillospiraceae bacterium]
MQKPPTIRKVPSHDVLRRGPPDAEIYDFFQEAAENLRPSTKARMSILSSKFQYVDEKAQVIDKFGTEDAAMAVLQYPTYILRPLYMDEAIDDTLRADIDDHFGRSVWRRKDYLMPYFQLQNTLMVNAGFCGRQGCRVRSA